jgi:2-dehydro-3-deoxyphosphogluconate aldolase/(4S)-4-hydroxy-2-oxoglutarate aldolase
MTGAVGSTALGVIERTRIIGIVRAASPAAALADAEALAVAGVEAIEVSLVTPDALDVIAALARSGRVVGVGTALTEAHVTDAAEAGAQFVVSPNIDERVIRATVARGLASIPGAGTVSEALRAREWGADLVKLFPATVFGPKGVAAILASLPELPLAPTGGVGIGDIRAFLDAGARAVGMGQALVRAAHDDPEGVRAIVTN